MFSRALVIGLLGMALPAAAQTYAENRSVRAWAAVQNAPPRITINWASHPNTNGFDIYRKVKGGTSWGTSLAYLTGATVQYVDNNVLANVSYEYKVVRYTSNLGAGYGYVNAGIELAMVEDRGKLVLIVDNTFSTTLATQLTQLQTDLEGDGWRVIRHDVSRTGPVSGVKALISADYNADPTKVKAVFIVGHAPVPYSGNLAPDGHGNHYGAWPSDAYYGEMNGTWTDNSINTTGATDPRNHNVVGDGKFDQNALPSAVELQVGRVDLANLPAFSQSEQALLSSYLTKLHNWKVKLLTATTRAVIDDNFTGYTDAFANNGWRGFAPLVHPSNIIAGDYFGSMTGQSYLWSYGCGGGWWDNANGIGTTAQFATSNLQSIFTILFGSYFGDWDCTNNFMRASLASGTTLTNFWAGYPNWFFHHMGMGETIGYAAQLTQNNGNGHYELANPNNGRVHIGLMGDPTLRMAIVAPPGPVVCTYINSSTASISWTASSETVLGYHVYRFDGSNWVRRTTNAVTGTSFTDAITGLSGQVKYMVRALKLEVSYSGSYYNLSEGMQGVLTIGGQTTDCLGVVGGTALPGTSCNDGNANTGNDTWSAGCQCAGQLIDCLGVVGGSALPGTPCNDNNNSTSNDTWSASCFCVGQPVDCLGVPGGSALPGTPCNDGNVCTVNDTWNNSCQCTGSPGPDGDGDGICDANDYCQAVPGTLGSACNDGDPCTINDALNASCICAGTPSGDSDGDGLCNALDNCPNTPGEIGSPCNDGNACTINDVLNAACQCAGTSTGDSDGDGLCNAQDNCPNTPGQIGSACDDGNGSTINDQVNSSCQCIGTSLSPDTLFFCTTVSAFPDGDAEEATNGDIYNAAGPLDLVYDSDPFHWRGNQMIGLHFTNVLIPPNATILSANIQFTSRTTDNVDPCVLTVSIEDADDAAPIGFAPFDLSGRTHTPPQNWSPPVWTDLDARTADQRTPDIAPLVALVTGRPAWQSGNSMMFTVTGVGGRSAWSVNEDANKAAQLCISYVPAIPQPDCLGQWGGSALPGSPCDDGDATTGDDLWTTGCQCLGLLIDCAGVPGGSVLPGSPCDDGDALTGADAFGVNCQCAGLPLDCAGVPGGSLVPGAPCDDGDPLTGNDMIDGGCVCAGSLLDCAGVPGGSAWPGSPCDDGDALTGDDVIDANCQCAGVPLDCAGVPGGPDLPGVACDDGDAGTADDVWTTSCTCAGILIDCEGFIGGAALPGTPCDDGDPATGNDAWNTSCACAGQLIDCGGIPGGGALPGASCDDGDATTGNDVWTTACICAGQPLDCSGVPGGAALPGVPCDDGDPDTGNDTWSANCQCSGELIDCAGSIGGGALPGFPCDDGDPDTGNDIWSAACECAGEVIDCNGVVGGTALPGTPCNDGDPDTGDDTWVGNCQCIGLLIDCEGVIGGPALPGSACDDGDADTGNDQWNGNCSCAGLPYDCAGVPGGTALPGASCDDGNADTGNDAWTGNCLCVGQAYDCVGVAGGSALPGTPCDDGDENTAQDTWTASCSCVGIPIDCAGVPGGTATLDGCGTCTGGTTGIEPDPDADGDGALDCVDNCLEIANSDQADFDSDLIGNLCDNCPWIANADQADWDGNGVGDVCDQVGIDEIAGASSVLLRPNPSNGEVVVIHDDPRAARLVLFDVHGARVMDLPFMRAIDIGDMARGTYLLMVLDGQGGPIAHARLVRL